jgi:hypothetical protein
MELTFLPTFAHIFSRNPDLGFLNSGLPTEAFGNGFSFYLSCPRTFGGHPGQGFLNSGFPTKAFGNDSHYYWIDYAGIYKM